MPAAEDGWCTRMLDDSDMSDDDDALISPLNRVHASLSASNTSLATPQTVVNEQDDEAAYFAEEDLLDIGEIEETCKFIDNPFSIAKAAALARRRDRTSTPGPPPLAPSMPAAVVKKPEPFVKSNPLMMGFKKQQAKADLRKAEKALSSSKKKKTKKISPAGSESPFVAAEAPLDVADSNQIVPPVLDDAPRVEKAQTNDELQKITHVDAISLLCPPGVASRNKFVKTVREPESGSSLASNSVFRLTTLLRHLILHWK